MQIDNSKRKILIIGANGFLGGSILQLQDNQDIQDKNFFLIAADIDNSFISKEIPFYYIDITNPEDVMRKIIKISPEVVVLTAAMTNVDKNEIYKELATKINTDGPKNIIKACEKVNSKLVFISTDFVFDGISKNGNYNESDVANPLNHYGKTKYQAELAIMHSKIEYLICRTAVLYGWNKNKTNFITWVFETLQKKERVSLVKDQVNNATFVRNLAEILLKLISRETQGILHTAGDSSYSRYEMGIICADIFNLDKNLIKPLDNLQQKAERPKNVSLDVSKLKNILTSEIKIYNLFEGLTYMKNHQIRR
ncbi:MAG: SDR family oxidoreductase [Promethearchaeota archaeon]